jgi:hypothetical protein
MMTIEPTGYRLDDAIPILERTPKILQALLDGLPEIWVRSTEGDGTWSPYDVIEHLIHGERTDWIPRARHILSGNRSPFPPFDRSAQFSESRNENLTALLATFSSLRRESLDTLIGFTLTESDMTRTGIHPELGEVTLGNLLATWVVHDMDHVSQVARTMAGVYSKATGPWVAYLSILRDRQR